MNVWDYLEIERLKGHKITLGFVKNCPYFRIRASQKRYLNNQMKGGLTK